MRKIICLSICLAFIVAGHLFSASAQAQMDDFQMMPAEHNTYVVTYTLRGLKCVQGVGTATQCGVTNPSADEGGYPWTKVKCRPSDASVSTFAWSLDLNQPMGIFEAPPSISTSAETYTVNVRLGRVCMKSGSK